MLLVLNSPIHTTEIRVKVPDADSYEGADLVREKMPHYAV